VDSFTGFDVDVLANTSRPASSAGDLPEVGLSFRAASHVVRGGSPATMIWRGPGHFQQEPAEASTFSRLKHPG
jgi:hypothetical protein